MNIAIWIIVGGILGWISFSLLRFNVSRGLVGSVVIGIVGSAFGGDVLGPLIGPTVQAGHFNPLSLFMAFASAAGCLILSNMISRRFDV